MSSYLDTVNEISETILKGTCERKNYVIVGDNSSGKSDVLREVIRKDVKRTIYFIDSVNRTYDISKVELKGTSYKHVSFDYHKVLETRLEENNFNIQDTFCVIAGIELLYAKYSEQIKALLLEFLGVHLEIIQDGGGIVNVENIVHIDGERCSLSNGFQAIIRMISEILYFEEAMAVNGEAQGVVVIDEIDEYLSPRYSSKILEFLKSKFANMTFIVATHSIDLVENVEDIELIVMEKNQYTLYSNEALKDNGIIRNIFARIFFDDRFTQPSSDDSIDNRLRILLNRKIASEWDEKSQNELDEISEGDILPHQKMICKQIKEW